MAERKPNRKLTDQEVEYMLAKAVVQQVPDIYQQASSAPITPLTVVDEIVPRQFPRQRLRWQRLAAACVLLVLCAGGIFSWLWFSTKAVVSIDVNPSVALSLNRFEYVIDTQAGNTDGAEVLDDLSLKNLKLSTALDALMGAMSRKGYLDDQAQISVFVDGSDDDFNRELYDEITDDLAHLAPDAVTQVGESATAQPDTQQPAEQQTVEQPATEQPVTEQPSAEQTTEQPATDQTTAQPVTEQPASGQTAGQTGEQQPQQSASITEEQAKEIAANHAGVAVADLTFHSVSLEEDDGRRVYDVEFYSGSTEYDYEIDAATGDILSYDNDVENFSIPQQQSAQNAQGAATGSYIGDDAAKAAALQRAGLTEDQVRWEKC
ncbi:MAG TPA: PepSY domain-containing protein, partial [Candidatus Negativibacillus faecipullorum]|nr:PepSY domain-containing protein [Candidatus Negativibacillus faecipullorum]